MRSFLVVVVGVLGVGLPRAHATPLQIKPTRLELTANQPSTVVTLSNPAPTSVRFQVTAFKWKPHKDDEMRLEPTQDVTVFPSLFAVEGNSTRMLRVSVNARPAQGENAYRILVTELPTLTKPGQTIGVQVLTRLSIPIFVRAQNAKARPVLDEAKVEDDKITVKISNAGDSYLVVQKVAVVGKDSSGAVAIKKEASGWYVLSGDQRSFLFDLGAEAEKATQFEINALTNAGLLTRSLGR